MNEAANALRAAASVLLTKAAELDGQGPAVPGFNPDDWRTWWPAMLEQFKNDGLPHAWRDWTAGTPPDQVGDNDKPDDDFLRSFGPFLAACTRNKWEDSTGGIFFVPNIKKRGGLGKDGWDLVKWETRRLWNDPRGQAWRADPSNLSAGFVPEQAP